MVAAGLLAFALGVLGATLPVPLVALGPGPTYNTLGEVDGTAVVDVDGLPVYPASGHLNMTTVSVIDRLTLFSVLGFWASENGRVIPREAVFPSGMSQQEIQQQNTAQFVSSEANAESAALAELGIPATVIVTELVPGTPVAEILQPGDELLAVAGQPVDSVAAVTAALADTAAGETVGVTYRREGQEHEARVELAASPDRRHGLLGIIPGGIARGGDITISLGGIGGPSAGLIFALSVVDKLTPGDLTDGRFIAGTGTIGPTGVVGKIDGVPFKMHAAREAGATVFLVPAENCAEAVATAPDGLQLVRVETLHDAIAALEALSRGTPAPSC